MTYPSDHELLTAWRQGDQRAGAALLTRHYASVARFFRHDVKHMSVCDDLVQATFLGLLEGIDRFREEASFKTLLFAIARNKLYRYFRDDARDQQRFDTDGFDPTVASLAAHRTPLSQTLARQERDLQLRDALNSLPIDTRMMLELHYWENLKLEEIARIMELPVTTVKIRMHRGRKQVRATLAQASAFSL